MTSKPQSKAINRVLIAIYGVLALAALGRSSFELATKFNQAPLPYTLSAVAASLYLVVTISMIRGSSSLASFALAIELSFVLLVGFAGLINPTWFPQKTVWTGFGIGYGFFPLFMPVIGLIYLRKRADK
jgi:hypothetical protein